MTATTIDTAVATEVTAGRRTPPAPTSFRRVLRVEWRKMFDTRSGFWMLASIGILSVVATGATIIFGDRESLTFEDFASAVGIPMSVILPMIGVLSVTSEWSQRTALTTFTLVPSRGRTVAAKLVNVLAIGVAAMLIAMAVGAVGNVILSNAIGVETQWGISLAEVARIVLASEIGMLIGFVLGLVVRNSPGAIVGYFVYALVLPGISNALANAQDWWSDNSPWFDLNAATFPLYDNTVTSQAWAQLGVTSLLWLVIPGLIGLRLMLRSEVK
ncbi:MAG: ABC transporter permease [Nocardioidaceae bacterium]|nr:ABC transporter permease [Nocardioidaceae bacterium]